VTRPTNGRSFTERRGKTREQIDTRRFGDDACGQPLRGRVLVELPEAVLVNKNPRDPSTARPSSIEL
jgi:hypothetical protein